MNEILGSITSLPNLHPALVHFPIALLLTAIGFDLACLLMRRQVWLDLAAAALYTLGALGAGAAYLAGRQAADSVGRVSPAAEVLMTQHSDWAFYTLLAFAGIATLRIGIAWWGRSQTVIRVHRLRLLVLLAAVGGQWLLFETADRGGALVYRHGVAVALPKIEPSMPGDEGRASEPSGSPETRLAQAEGGSLMWTPLPSDLGALGTVLRPVEGTPAGVVVPVESMAAEGGLVLAVSGRAWLVLPGTFDDVRVEGKLGLTGFSGTVGIAHHVLGKGTAGIFEVSTEGELALVNFEDGARKVLDEGYFKFPGRPVTLTVSAVGSHLKGLVDEAVLVHGHISPLPPGNVGLLLDGAGVVRVLSIRVIPLT